MSRIWEVHRQNIEELCNQVQKSIEVTKAQERLQKILLQFEFDPCPLGMKLAHENATRI